MSSQSGVGCSDSPTSPSCPDPDAGVLWLNVSGEDRVPSGLIVVVVMEGLLDEEDVEEPLFRTAARSEARSTRVL